MNGPRRWLANLWRCAVASIHSRPDTIYTFWSAKMGSIATAPDAIPTVDISAFIADPSGESARNVVEAVRHACTTYGFFYLVGHGVSLEEQNKALDCAKLFFTLPLEEKLDVSLSKSLGKSHRGYEAPGIQTHKDGLLPDTKEVSRLDRCSLLLYILTWCLGLHHRRRGAGRSSGCRDFLHWAQLVATVPPEGSLSRSCHGVSGQDARCGQDPP